VAVEHFHLWPEYETVDPAYWRDPFYYDPWWPRGYYRYRPYW